jgi:hypothetical protein
MTKAAQPSFEYLLSASTTSLESLQLSRMDQIAALKSQIRDSIEAWATAELDVRLTRLILETRVPASEAQHRALATVAGSANRALTVEPDHPAVAHFHSLPPYSRAGAMISADALSPVLSGCAHQIRMPDTATAPPRTAQTIGSGWLPRPAVPSVTPDAPPQPPALAALIAYVEASHHLPTQDHFFAPTRPGQVPAWPLTSTPPPNVAPTPDHPRFSHVVAPKIASIHSRPQPSHLPPNPPPTGSITIHFRVFDLN